ncbi:MAG: DUF4350 domain-containing protein [Chloroflexi bacterium]|nr:DUF4350 domain-containing protein [Chloroflexota bacterium]
MRSRDFTTFIILFVLLVGVAVISATQRSAEDPRAERNIPATTYSADDNGALALHSWLNEVGYHTERIENTSSFDIGDDTRVLFILDPSETITAREVTAIMRWVERGNTLVIADNWSFNSDNLLRVLRVEINYVDRFVTRATVVQPVRGLGATQVVVNASHEIKSSRDDAIVFLRADNLPALVTFPQGKGKVWVSSTPYLFSNAGLQDEENAALVLALVSDASRNSIVAFDEFHHGYRTVSADPGSASLNALIFQTPWGWALIFALVVIVAYLFVGGQRFGRAMPLPQAIERRNPAEYVSAVARLLRRGGKRAMILNHYRRQIKRVLGRPYHLNPDLSDDEFVAELARYREVDRAALLATLRELSPQRVNEKSLVKLAAQAIQATERAPTPALPRHGQGRE